jgi:polyhydroxyalkanoate synthesis regulator phasin
MAKKAAKIVEAIEERSPLFEAARKVLLASMGAVALTQEEADKFVKKLVERGEIAEKDARKLLREVQEKRKKGATELDKRLEEALDRLSVPTKADIEALGAKIAALAEKVGELKKA